MRRYDAILLDADDTLMDFLANERAALEEVFRWLGLPLDDGTALLYSGINQGLWEEHERGRFTRDEILVMRYQRLFDRLELSADPAQANRVFLAALGNGIQMLEGALEVCRDLNRDYRLYIASNGVLETQRRRLADSGLAPFMTGIFISEEMGSQKPSAAFFREALRRMGSPDPARVLMVGDSLTADIQGGKNAGMDTCWMNHRGRENASGVEPTYEISSLYQLRGVLRD